MTFRRRPQSPGSGRVADMAARDLAWIVVASVLVVALAIHVRVVDLALRQAEQLEGWNADGVFALVVVFPVAGAIYSYRRYREAVRLRAQYAQMSFQDSLTGLPNRRYLDRELGEVLRRARRHEGRIALLFCDLDHFKAVNEAYGHVVGDQLMVAATARISDALGEHGTLIRFGGDELVVIGPRVSTVRGAEHLGTQVLEALERPFTMGPEEIQLGCSVGIALTEARCSDAEGVLRDADAAMAQAKASGSGGVVVYDRSTRQGATPQSTERRLREALEQGQFLLHYQPVVSLQNDQLVGVEALLRWQDPERGLVGPVDFIPALEETGLIVPVGSWVLEEAFRQAHEWHEALPERAPVKVNVNVSARQLARPQFLDVLTAALRSSSVDPTHICLEITEGALLYDVGAAWSALRQAKDLGLGLALDDFGTGYSSLSHLRQFSLDVVKLDKAFVDGVGSSREDTTIVEHLVGMARGLGMVTVAEGVETAEQAALLRGMGCQLAQGFLYCAAKEAEVMRELLVAHAPAWFEQGARRIPSLEGAPDEPYPTWAVNPPSTASTAPVT